MHNFPPGNQIYLFKSANIFEDNCERLKSIDRVLFHIEIYSRVTTYFLSAVTNKISYYFRQNIARAYLERECPFGQVTCSRYGSYEFSACIVAHFSRTLCTLFSNGIFWRLDTFEIYWGYWGRKSERENESHFFTMRTKKSIKKNENTMLVCHLSSKWELDSSLYLAGVCVIDELKFYCTPILYIVRCW